MNRKLPYATGKRTRYAGISFRSATEAAWAETLDSAGVRWMYESRRFNFRGDLYLPDFELVGVGWLEVKPLPLTPHEDYLLSQLAVYTQVPCYAGIGKPWEPDSLLRYEALGGVVSVMPYPVLALLTGMEGEQ